MTPNVVSIVIPCYRGTRYLAEAIDSCLRQTYRELDVIVVDDASPENDAEIAEEFARREPRVRVIRRERNGGICHALNSGYDVARGEFLTRLAQDDLFREDAIETLVNHLKANPDAGLAYCDWQMIDAQGRFMQPMKTEAPERALLPANRVGLCVMWPRHVWDRVGPFDPHFTLCDDYEFFLRISRQFRLTRCEGVAPFFFRYHSEQASIQRERAHDIACARVHIAHNWALLRSGWRHSVLWKRLITSQVRLIACHLGLYGFFKYDGKKR